MLRLNQILIKCLLRKALSSSSQDLEGSVDEVLSEEELESLAVNVGSLNNQRNNGNSDTEGDFLDKSFDEKKSVLARANKQLELEDNEYKENMADDENSVCGSDMDRVRDKKSVKVDKSSVPSPFHLKHNHIISSSWLRCQNTPRHLQHSSKL